MSTFPHFINLGLTLLPHVVKLLIPSILIALVLVGIVALQSRVLRLGWQKLVAIGVAACTFASLVAYVYWDAYANLYYQTRAESDGETGTSFTWRLQYPAEEPLWTFVRDNLPNDATIAIANTFFVYPFQDTHYHRQLGYAPVRRGLHDFLSFPRLGDTVPGDLIVQRMTDVMNEEADKATWLENLRRMNAQYVVVAAFKHETDPPEHRFIAEEAGRFEKMFDAPAGQVYRVVDSAITSPPPATGG